MADSGGDGITHAGAVSLPVNAAGGTGNIVFCRIGQDGKLFHKRLILLDIHGVKVSFLLSVKSQEQVFV